MKLRHISFIGTQGIPNRYGGFESFLEQCAYKFLKHFDVVEVTCQKSIYPDGLKILNGVKRTFINIPANGAYSIFHDLIAFIKVVKKSTHIVVLGVSGGIWFPAFRILCDINRIQLIVNVDGVESRRGKHAYLKQKFLEYSDLLAQKFSHTIVIDNKALSPFIKNKYLDKLAIIAYPGDHANCKEKSSSTVNGLALTICRVEPENQIELLIEACLRSISVKEFCVIGNWQNSNYGLMLKHKYQNVPKIKLLDPIYDSEKLFDYRSKCNFYLHGHSVGGTNPSLVEMLYFDCEIFAYDCSFNRETGGYAIKYFKDISELVMRIDATDKTPLSRDSVRVKYSSDSIMSAYYKILF